MTVEEEKIKDCIDSLKSLDFVRKEYRIKQRNDKELGYIDYAWEGKKNLLVLFEYEGKQAHPCTNVLKVWPYLEDFPDKKVLLFQYFAERSRESNSSRMRLAEFLGEKLINHYKERFKYFPYYGKDESMEHIIGNIKKECEEFIEFT